MVSQNLVLNENIRFIATTSNVQDCDLEQLICFTSTPQLIIYCI